MLLAPTFCYRFASHAERTVIMLNIVTLPAASNVDGGFEAIFKTRKSFKTDFFEARKLSNQMYFVSKNLKTVFLSIKNYIYHKPHAQNKQLKRSIC